MQNGAGNCPVFHLAEIAGEITTDVIRDGKFLTLSIIESV